MELPAVPETAHPLPSSAHDPDFPGLLRPRYCLNRRGIAKKRLPFGISLCILAPSFRTMSPQVEGA